MSKVKTLGEYLIDPKVQKKLFTLIGKTFSDYTKEVQEENLFQAYDQTTYKVLEVWKDSKSGDLMAKTDDCDFGEFGSVGESTLNLSKPNLARMLDFPELIEGVNAEIVCPMALGPSI